MSKFRSLVNFLDQSLFGLFIFFSLLFTVMNRNSVAYMPVWYLYVGLMLTWLVGKIWFWIKDRRHR